MASGGRMSKLILGFARHGKDTFARQYCRDNPGTRFSSSSWFAAKHFIFDVMVDNGYGYNTVEECYADRHQHRELWHNLIRQYNHHDGSRFARWLLQDNDLYVGMRARREVWSCFSDELFDAVYWVDASDRLPAEGAESMDFDFQWLRDCPIRNCELIRIDNNSTMTEGERYSPNDEPCARPHAKMMS